MPMQQLIEGLGYRVEDVTASDHPITVAKVTADYQRLADTTNTSDAAAPNDTAGN